jgi:hypothetical protein
MAMRTATSRERPACASQEQIRDVGARDEQDADDATQQNQQRRLGVADQARLVRRHLNHPAAIVFRVILRERRRNRRHLGLCGVNGHTRLHPADRVVLPKPPVRHHLGRHVR